MKKVYVMQPIHPKALAQLKEQAEVIVGFGDDAVPVEEAILECEGLLIRTAPLSGDVIRQASQLKVIARHGVGVDNIDVAAATECGIVVANTPDANVFSVAEHVIGAMLTIARDFTGSNRRVREGHFGERDQHLGMELHGKTLGIVGTGRIGSQVAKMAKAAFAMNVIGYDPYASNKVFEALGIERVTDLDQLFREADVVTTHVPLTPETRHLVGRNRLRLMKPGSILVHASRGGVVDEEALEECLRDGHLRGAAVDVFVQEPTPDEHAFYDIDNMFLSPHVAAHTEDAMFRMAWGAAEEILRVLAGDRPTNVVNPAALDRAS